jgi:WD40 repeat protein
MHRKLGLSALLGAVAVLGWSNPCMAQPYACLDTDGSVDSVAFSRGGSLLAANMGSSPRTIVVWDLTGPKRIHLFNKPPIFSGRLWFPEGNTLVQEYGAQNLEGGLVSKLVKWDLTTGQRDDERELPYPLLFSAVSPDGKVLIAANGYPTRELKVCNSATLQPTATLEAADKNQKQVTHADFSRDGSVLVTVARAGTIKVFDSKTWKEKAAFKSANGVTRLAVAPKGDLVAVGVQNTMAGGSVPYLEFYEVATGKRWAGLDNVDATKLMPFCFSPDGKVFAVFKRGIALWDVATGKKVGHIPSTRRTRNLWLLGFEFSPTGTFIATWYSRPGIYLWAMPDIKQAK